MVAVTVDAERLLAALAVSKTQDASSHLHFVEWDQGDAYTCMEGQGGAIPRGHAVQAEVIAADPKQHEEGLAPSLALLAETKLVLLVSDAPESGGECGQLTAGHATAFEAGGLRYLASAYVRSATGLGRAELRVIPYRTALYERRRGILETPVLESKCVAIFGLGTGGAFVAAELAKSGVGSFILVDHDRLDVGNVVRHNCGLTDVGRFKTKAVADLVRGKNPYLNVETREIRANWDVREEIEALIRRSDLVICATDNRESKLLVNRLCVMAGVTAIYGGAFRRAYGGQVLVARPGITPCYQCFVHNLPEPAADQEISGAEEAEGIAYSDRPVAIEPGLSIDVAPISTMVAKIAVLELLRGTDTTLSSLYEDLATPWYLWANRREPETGFAGLAPLDVPDRMTVLRWYGVNFDRDDDCPVCGQARDTGDVIPESSASPPLEAL